MPMKNLKLTPSLGFSLALTLWVLVFSCLSPWVFEYLSLERAAVAQGQAWRLLTDNLVHFGWAHTAMNLGAFLLCSFGLLPQYNLPRFITLLLVCCLAVGVGIYLLNPEYGTYAGLSGAIHGLIIAGLLQSTLHPLWLRAAALGIVVVKLVQEQSPNYQATDLQNLIPVPVAADAHLYGALAGLTFVIADWLLTEFKKRNAQ
jgi:rhomboid family GlyGly-CTERM serine protease